MSMNCKMEDHQKPVLESIKIVLDRMYESLLSTRKGGRQFYDYGNRSPEAEDEAILIQLARDEPKAFSPPNRDNRATNILHDVCRAGASLDCVRAVYEACPAAIGWKNGYKRLPIHEACLRGASLEVVQFLVQENPASLRATDNEDKTPLHRACYGGLRPWRVDIIEFLAKSCPEMALSQCHGGATPLAVLLSISRGFGHDRAIPHEAVRQLLAAAPSAISMVDSHGKKPIDYVLGWCVWGPYKNKRKDLSFQTLELVLDHSQTTSSTAIHDLWNLIDPDNWNLRLQTLSWWSKARGSPIPCDNDGIPNCPLHATLRAALHSKEHFASSLEQFQSELGKTDKDGRLPLHVALSCQGSTAIPSSVILQMIKAEPLALFAKDPVSNLYPFIMACDEMHHRHRFGPKDHLSIIFQAMIANPALLFEVEFPVTSPPSVEPMEE